MPYVDLGTNARVVAIDASNLSTCALLDDGGLKCWGSNFYGQLGQGHGEKIGDEPDEMGDDLPAIDLGEGRSVRAFDVASGTVCAQLDDDSVKCWGLYAGGGKEPGSMGDNLEPIAAREDLGYAKVE